MRDAECVEFLRWCLPRLGLSWPGFRKVRGQVCKRIGRRLRDLGLANVAAYRRRLAAEPGEWAVLDGLCHITISRFYRDRGVYERLAGQVLPALARAALAAGRGELRCWSAGCASGEEAYGLSILWRLGPGRDFPGLTLAIVATDAERAVLERARRGCYAAASLKEAPRAWLEAAFERRGRCLCVRRAYREGISFRREDIRRRMPRGPFDLILCRNLAFTYFDDEGRRRTLARLRGRLRPGGVLVIGAHERLPEGLGFAPHPLGQGLYLGPAGLSANRCR